ncbi:DUF1002 domain-containing protein [Neobacillus drentensis]|uniref:DUF1002 domain-containing protein n=1 Tax=Neobacillus drentensis TaxID=220684 RepID=UPI002FFE106C
MQNVMIVGAGKGGTAILKILKESEVLKVSVVIDRNLNAPGILLARTEGINTGTDWQPYLTDQIDIIIEVTGNEVVFQELRNAKNKQTVLIPGSVAFLVAKIMEEKEDLIEKHKNESYQQELIFNATNDGMVVIDKNGKVILFNTRAQEIIGVTKEQAIGKYVVEVIPTSRLPFILESRRIEANQEMVETAKLGDSIGDENAAALIAKIKEEIAKKKPKNDQELQNIIEQAAKELNVKLTDEEMQRLIDFFNKLKDLNIDWNQVSDQLNKAKDRISNFLQSEEGQGFLDKLKQFFTWLIDTIKSIFS